jgi:hypothetical protein
MEFIRSTRITRSWSRTLATSLFAAALLGLASYLLYENPSVDADIEAVVLLIFSVAGAWTAITHSYTGYCPACGSRQQRLGGLHRCSHCLAYGEVVKREYRELESDRVFKTAVFAARLPEQCHMPKLCTACGLPAASSQRLRIIRKKFAFDLDVPHCELHTGGADLATELIKEGVWSEIPVLKVASYGFYREFLKQNSLGMGQK